MTPQKTRRFVINLEIENKGKSLQMIPMAVLAESMKSSPVTAMQITVLWFKIFNKASICLRKHYRMHKHTATPIFFVFFLFESIMSRAKVTKDIKRAAKVIAPKADLNIHL